MEEGPKTYDIRKYERPSVTVDIILFTMKEDDLKVLLIKRGNWPYKGKWAIPGGFIKMKEALKRSAAREIKEELGLEISDVKLEQLYTFGDPKRDPRTRVITVVYFGFLLSDKYKKIKPEKGTVLEAKWFSVYKLPKLAFDHNKIIDYAHKRLKNKLAYSTIAMDILSELFTLTELQRVYELILGEEFDKRNFRKKIFSMGMIEITDKYKLGSHRPARLYRFKKNMKKGSVSGFRWTKMEL